MMFYNIYSADFSSVLIPSYFVFCVGMLFLVYFLGAAFALLTIGDCQSRGAFIQACYRGNLVLMGLPIMQNLMGEEALGLTAIMLAVIVPLYNILAVVTLEVFRGGKIHPAQMVRKILTNPLILGAAAGICAVAFGITVPEVFLKPVSQVASAATPAALLIMGASFYFGSVRDNLRNIVFGVLGKLILSPIPDGVPGHPSGASDRDLRRALCGIQLHHGAADGQQRRTGSRVSYLFFPVFVCDHLRMDLFISADGSVLTKAPLPKRIPSGTVESSLYVSGIPCAAAYTASSALPVSASG